MSEKLRGILLRLRVKYLVWSYNHHLRRYRTL